MHFQSLLKLLEVSVSFLDLSIAVVMVMNHKPEQRELLRLHYHQGLQSLSNEIAHIEHLLL